MKRPFSLISSTTVTCLLLLGSTATTTTSASTSTSTTTSAFSSVHVSSFVAITSRQRLRRRQQQQQQHQRRQLHLPKHGALLSKTKLYTHSSSRRHSSNNNNNNNSNLSLTDLLQRLDEQGIRYPPTASKQQLDQLLLFNERKQQQQEEDNEEIEDALMKGNYRGDDSDAELGRNNGKRKPMNLYEEDADVDADADSFTRNGSRIESKPAPFSKQNQQQNGNTIEHQHVKSSWQMPDEAQKPTEKKPAQQRSLGEILQQLDEANLRYPPTATRQELEQMLQQYQVEQQQQQQQRQQKQQRSVQEDQHIQRARRRTRRIALKSTSTSTSTSASPWSIPRLLRKSRHRALSLSQPVVDRAKRQARKVSRKVSDLLTIDEDGIRDVEYTYLYKENIRKHLSKEKERPHVVVDVQVVSRKTIDDDVDDLDHDDNGIVSRIQPEATTSQSVRSDWRPPQHSTTIAGQTRQSSSSPRREPADVTSSSHYSSSRAKKSMQPNRSTTPIDSNEPLQPPLALPPINHAHNGSSKPPQRPSSSPSIRPRPHDRTTRSNNRRIYSPYSKGNKFSPQKSQEELFNDNRDAFDRFGDFLADAADRVMWGAYDNDDGYRSGPENKSAPKVKKKPFTGKKHPQDSSFQKTGVNETATTSSANKKHWKDRLEERFDYLLGIHEDGEYYNRWANREENEREQEGGFDPLSVAQGRQPKRSGVYPRRKKKYNKPIWEEEGNLVSLLFGRTPKGNSLLFEKLLDQDSGTLVNLFRSVFKSLLLVTSYLCRWASVGGALPQPLVVLGLTTTGLCARKKLRAMVIALILLRTAGELAHGYLYGNDGWEDDNNDDDDDDDYEKEKMPNATK